MESKLKKKVEEKGQYIEKKIIPGEMLGVINICHRFTDLINLLI